jgi:hypothetical protein|tara:strand:- start:845 stop:1564 length:720 start_codon:yes stop_codon:yes gene_type:complete
LKLYLITSNKYTATLCPLNIHFLNKYWPNLDITIVGYEEVLSLQNLPENVSVVSVGTQSDFGATWTNALIPFFKQIPESYFALTLDDHILMNEVDDAKIQTIEEQFQMAEADKAMIGGGIPLSSTTDFRDNLLLFNQDVDYRTSLHPAIWTKRYFLKYLKPNMSSWDFELKNNDEAKYDGCRIINYKYDYPNEPHVFSYLELFTKGAITINDEGETITNQPSSRYFSKEDIQYIWKELQ